MEPPPESPTLPFLRWAGSKRQHASLLASYWNQSYRRYVEPFLGSGVLYFHLCPPRALLGDVNRDLIATFRQVKANPIAVSRILHSFQRGSQAYYRLRSHNGDVLRPSQKAARFIYLNRFCFNGIYRTNSRGVFNVPYGGERSGPLPSAAHLKASSRSLAVARLAVADFETLLDEVRQGDFVYMDPPYSVRARRTFAEYYPSGFTPEDVKRLRAVLMRLDRKGIPFLLTYADSHEARSLSRGFATRIVTTRRNVAGFIGDRRRAREVIVSNAPPA